MKLIFSFILLAILPSHFAASSDEAFNQSTLFKFHSNLTRCPMFVKFCKIPFAIDSSANITQLIVNHTKTRFYKYDSLELCENRTLGDCKSHFEAEFGNFKTGFLIIHPKLVGKSHLTVHLSDKSAQNDTESPIWHQIVITSPERIVDKIHLVAMIVLQSVISLIMGILLDVHSIMKIIKMPVPVLAGFFTQYICMPLLAYLCIKTFSLSSVEAFALFIYGCCPGGSQSNNWTILFDGDIDLSAIMTFVSTMSSLICMPAWIYSLGRSFTTETNIDIPYTRLIANLFGTILPCLIGLLISYFYPKLKKFFIKMAKPFTLISLAIVLGLTFYVKFYVFALIEWKQWLVAPFVPWSGFLIGAVIATIFRFKLPQIMTVAIETGIQNFGIAFIIVFYNFPSPEADYAILPLISVSLLTPIPLWILLASYTIYKRRLKRKELDAKAENGEDENETTKMRIEND